MPRPSGAVGRPSSHGVTHVNVKLRRRFHMWRPKLAVSLGFPGLHVSILWFSASDEQDLHYVAGVVV
eukprot:2649225-Lingulodinium_polyedra.AAC.1